MTPIITNSHISFGGGVAPITPPAYVTKATAAWVGSTNTITITGIQSGDYVLWVRTVENDVNYGNGWILLDSQLMSGIVYGQVYYRVTTGTSESATYSTGGGHTVSNIMYAYRNVSSIAESATRGSSGTCDPPARTVANGDLSVIATTSVINYSAVSSGYTNATIFSRAGMAEKAHTSASTEDPSACTGSDSFGWTASHIVLTP